MNFDDMIKNILGKKKPSNGKRIKPLRLGMNTFKSNMGASLKMQSQWRKMSPRMKNINRMLFKDSDGDRVPNKWDCSPFNVMRQDWSKLGNSEMLIFNPKYI